MNEGQSGMEKFQRYPGLLHLIKAIKEAQGIQDDGEDEFPED